MSRGEVATPSQTSGPFLSIGTEWNARGQMVDPSTPGAVTISGRVFDGAGAPVIDALLEIWQADPAGRFPPATASSWTGFGRTLTDRSGAYRICTLKPGALPLAGGGVEAPHLDVSIFARGLLQRLVTRIYFSDDTEVECDPLLSSISDAEVRASLIARRGASGYHHDLWLQGDKETAFFVP